jgi:predicted flap endonuclease-1-like 5' DNA nuclease
MANMKVEEVEGFGPSNGTKLGTAGIKDTDTLLKLCCDKKGRKETAEKSGISEGQLLKWANMCDLFRIKGVGPEYAELLEAAGVDTVKELRNRNAANLAEACAKVNEEKKLTRSVPSEKVVSGWVDQAKDLPPVITH